MQHELALFTKVLLSVVIPLSAFATGLQAPTGQPLWLLRRKPLLGRSLLAILIIVPVGVVAMARLLRLSPSFEAGLVIAVVAIGMGPIAILQHARDPEAQRRYELSLNVTLCLASIVFVPALVALHAASQGIQPWLGAGPVASLVFTRQLLPLLAGLLFVRLLPGAAQRVAHVAGTFVKVAILVVLLILVVALGRALAQVGVSEWLATVALVVGALAVGHALGGPERDTRAVLAMFSAMRFPALALLLASAVPRGKAVLPGVLAYIVVSAVLTALYGLVVDRRARRRPTPLKLEPSALRGA